MSDDGFLENGFMGTEQWFGVGFVNYAEDGKFEPTTGMLAGLCSSELSCLFFRQEALLRKPRQATCSSVLGPTALSLHEPSTVATYYPLLVVVTLNPKP